MSLVARIRFSADDLASPCKHNRADTWRKNVDELACEPPKRRVHTGTHLHIPFLLDVVERYFSFVSFPWLSIAGGYMHLPFFATAAHVSVTSLLFFNTLFHFGSGVIVNLGGSGDKC